MSNQLTIAQQLAQTQSGKIQPHSEIPLQHEHIALCVDCSGSMSCDWDGKPRSDHAQQGIQTILSASDHRITSYTLVRYGSHAETIVSETSNYTKILLLPSSSTYGGTQIFEAIKHTLQCKPDRIILLSDGETHQKSHCLELARQCGANSLPIDTIAIGECEIAFMREIAQLSNGTFHHATTPKLLQNSFFQLETSNYQALADLRGKI